MKRHRVAGSGKAEKANLALMAQPLKWRHDLTNDLWTLRVSPPPA
jgi:hypothetical protein